MGNREYNIGDIVEYKGKRGIVVSKVWESNRYFMYGIYVDGVKNEVYHGFEIVGYTSIIYAEIGELEPILTTEE